MGMAENKGKATEPAPRSLESRKRLARLNVAVMAVLGLFILVAVNWIGSRHYDRYDMTQQNRFSLSDKTRAVLGELETAVDVTVLYQDGPPLFEVKDLLEEYEATGKAMFRVRYIDPARDIDDARLFIEGAGLNSVELDTVVFQHGDNVKAVPRGDVYEFQGQRNPYGQPPPPLFKGEQAFTSALLAVTQERQTVVYFTTGHGEKSPEVFDRNGYSEMSTALKRDNYDVRTWNPTVEPEVPGDCDVMIVAGPTKPFAPTEAGLIEGYVGAGGKLLLLIDPAGEGVAADVGLRKLLGDWSVRVRTDVVALSHQRDPFGQAVISSQVAAAEYGFHEITEKIKSLATLYLHAAVVEPSTGGGDEQRKPVSIVKTSESSWGETDISDTENIKFDEGRDIRGPLSLGVAMSEGPPPGMPPGMPPPEGGARLVVLGDSDFAVNQMTSGFFAAPGNQDFFLACVNWLAEKGALVAISPKPPDMRQADLSDPRPRVILYTCVFGLPGLGVIFGLAVWWRRRK